MPRDLHRILSPGSPRGLGDKGVEKTTSYLLTTVSFFFSISSYFIICIVYFFFFYFITFYVGINDSSIVDRKLIFWKAFEVIVRLREV